MRVTELKAGVGVERATASGTIDFNSPDMPFIMSVSIENVSLQRLLRDMSGFIYSPAGLLNGEAMISGGLKNFYAEYRKRKGACHRRNFETAVSRFILDG